MGEETRTKELGKIASSRETSVNNSQDIKRYFWSARLLVRQIEHYRKCRQDEEQYVLILRFMSLIVESLPQHVGFRVTNPQYAVFKKKLTQYLDSIDQLRAQINARPRAATRSGAAAFTLPQRTVIDSNLSQIDWKDSIAAGTAARSQGVGVSAAWAAEAAAAHWAVHSEQPASSCQVYDLSVLQDSLQLQQLVPTPPAAAAAQLPPPPPPAAAGLPSLIEPQAALPDLSSWSRSPPAMPGASSSALAKHSLFATPSSASPSAADPAPPRTGVRYPEFDASPIDDSAWRPRPPQPPAPAPAPAPADAAAAALDGLVVPVPSAVALGPQELEVNHVQPLPGAPPPGASCNHAAPPAPTDSGPKELRKKDALQEVHVSVEVMEQFLRYAISNTRQGIESCGILAGKLQPSGQGDGHDIFTINTLIIPKQKGSSDMVEMLNEEEVFELQFARELYPLGWIHTHPTQSCFLSSVDVHTQCGFQIMLQEAVAIVMAPTDQQRRCGIFRLTVPGGMELIQRCPLKGFHAHPPTSTGQEIYELSGHVYLNETIPFEVVDLR